MTIRKIVEQYGLPVFVVTKNKSYPQILIHTSVDNGWLVDYNGNKDHFVSDSELDDYDTIGT